MTHPMTEPEIMLYLLRHAQVRCAEEGDSESAERVAATVADLEARVNLRRRPVFPTTREDEFPYAERPMGEGDV